MAEKGSKEEGYVPYTGQEIAEFSPAFAIDSSESFTFQYCTECIVLAPSIEANELK